MGMDVGLTYGVRIKRKKITLEFEGCDNCGTEITTKCCPECGSKKTKFERFNFVCKVDTWEDFKDKIEECYDGEDDYVYITDGNCLDEADDNPRAGDMMFFQPNELHLYDFVQETIKSVKEVFGIDLEPDDFGYFISMSY